MPNITSGSVFADIGLNGPVEREKKRELGQEDFLKLLTTQLQFQDPLKPTDNTEFIGQMTQFSSLDALNRMNASFSSLSDSLTSSQALQASSMVGRTVLVKGAKAMLGEEGTAIAGRIDVPARTFDVKITVKNAQGEVVNSYHLPGEANAGKPIEKGEFAFSWDGKTETGGQAPPGVYSVSAEAMIDGKNQQLNTSMWARVGSVNLFGPDGVSLNLLGMGTVAMKDVKEISG